MIATRCPVPWFRAHPAAALVGVIALLEFVIGAGGCSESAFSPAASESSCGSADAPCAFSCKDRCADRIVDAAERCIVTLEGRLDAARKVCSFDDGSRALFAAALPLAGEIDATPLSLTLEHDGATCLSIERQPPLGEGPERLEVTVGDHVYRQALWTPAPAAHAEADGGARDGAAADGSVAPPDRLEVTCADGISYRGVGTALCGDCAGGDCAALSLLRVDVRLAPAIELRLTTRTGRTTPLFNCSAAP